MMLNHILVKKSFYKTGQMDGKQTLWELKNLEIRLVFPAIQNLYGNQNNSHTYNLLYKIFSAVQ